MQLKLQRLKTKCFAINCFLHWFVIKLSKLFQLVLFSCFGAAFYVILVEGINGTVFGFFNFYYAAASVRMYLSIKAIENTWGLCVISKMRL